MTACECRPGFELAKNQRDCICKYGLSLAEVGSEKEPLGNHKSGTQEQPVGGLGIELGPSDSVTGALGFCALTRPVSFLLCFVFFLFETGLF